MLNDLLDSYLTIFPKERTQLAALTRQIEAGERLNDRKNFRGHITAAGIVLAPSKKKILLVHHKALGLWLQPGGHWDVTDSDLIGSAQREVAEETAVQLAHYLPLDHSHEMVPIDIGAHLIPQNAAKQEPKHYHYDFRYVFVAASKELHIDLAEVNSAAWFSLDDPKCEHIQPIILKLREFGFVEL